MCSGFSPGRVLEISHAERFRNQFRPFMSDDHGEYHDSDHHDRLPVDVDTATGTGRADSEREGFPSHPVRVA